MILSTFFAPILLTRIARTPQRGILRRIQDWQAYRRLAQMEDRLLCDIGLTRDQVRAASQFWDVPTKWRKK